MPRIMIKGGIFNNVEDEILKAAVMKYGKNMWDRVASLLTRKSAKQCKARWHEWLDPSIKKTEWSREEEEKLLHLAKLMPTQWRTIAPIVGRTPGQCLEHYEFLLDQAQRKEEGDDTGIGVDGAAADDPRRLRPGEIDPNPEMRPARPDFVDMDEDEKEMLNEARARLANTRGKKAKRKAREKQLTEARRLGSLQKSRELRAAGIASVRRRKPKKGEIDYAAEIPFEKDIPTGFHSVDEEEQKEREMDEGFRIRSLLDLEGKSKRVREADERREDAKKERKRKQDDLINHEMQVSRLSDPAAARKRTKLSLPAPQITERELEDARVALRGGVTGGDGVTSALVGAYGETPATITPMRTPAKQNAVMEEARNLAALTAQTTPLIGGANPDLSSGTAFAGATPHTGTTATPNVLTTPMQGGGGATPAFSVRDGSTPMSTPMRDIMGINRDELKRQRMIREAVKSGLSHLPEPNNDYEVVLPSAPVVEEKEEKLKPDAGDIDAQIAAEKKRIEEEEMAKRPIVIRRGLPRPMAVMHVPKLADIIDSFPDEPTARAYIEIQSMASALMKQHAVDYPIPGLKVRRRPEIDTVTDEEMNAAKKLLEQGSVELSDDVGNIIFVPSIGRYMPVSLLSTDELVDAYEHEHKICRDKMSGDNKSAAKLENKMNILTQGYAKKAEELRRELDHVFDGIDRSSIELQCFKALQMQERAALPHRLDQLRNDVAVVREIEDSLQQEHSELVQTKNEQ